LHVDELNLFAGIQRSVRGVAQLMESREMSQLLIHQMSMLHAQ
jgi:hypothetical protein